MNKQPCVYILSNQKNGTLYVGVSSNLIQRIYQHKQKLVDGFSKKYGLDLLVWYEQHESMYEAIKKEKALKKWNREWKIRLIEEENPQWLDLYGSIIG